MSELVDFAALIAWMDAQTAPALLTIDGPAGAGKSTLTDRIATARPEWRVVHLDNVYPGWEGLRSAIASIRDALVIPLLIGEAGSWPEWSWPRARVHAVRQVPAGSLVILDGCGATETVPISMLNANVRRVWVDAPAELRAQRLARRDGSRYDAHWAVWEEHWSTYVAASQPHQLCERFGG